MSDNLELTAAITTEEPEIAATLGELRYLVFQGMKGDTGDSAYEEAVSLGFVGTEAEWIASLKGETGANGRDGQDGAPGTPGRDGVSPTVQTTAITGGHRVTITDAEHPSGQTFDVMDGDSAIVPAYIDTDVIRYLNDHGTHATDDIYTSLLMREDVDSGVLPFIVRPTGSDSTTEEYFELDHQIHSADSPVIHFRSREHLLAVDSTGHFTMTDRPQIDSVNGKTGAVVLDASDVGALPADTPIPAAVTEQTVAGWGFTKNAVRYDEQMALSDTQKATARANIGAVGQLEYDALESDIESLEADLSLKLDAADAPTKVSDLQNDTGYITASQVPAAPVQSVNGMTGSVTVNEVPDASGASVGQVLSKTANGLGWTTPSGGGGGSASLVINLYYHSSTDSYTTSAGAAQLYNALPNCALAAAEHTIPVSAYKKDGTNYVTAIFVDQSFANGDTSAIVWALTAATSSSTVTVTREVVSVNGVPDATSATVGQVLTKTQYGPRWADSVPSSGAALRLLYDGAFAPDDPDLMLMGNVANTETGNAIATALYTGRIGSAVLVDVTDSNTEVVYDLFAVDYDAQTHVSTVTFARTESDCIRTATLSGSTKTAPVFGTIPLAGGSAENAVLYTPMNLTHAQQEQARGNIGAGTYTKPSGGIPASDLASGVIPSVPQMATQANMSDWTSGKTVDAAVLKAGFQGALQALENVGDAIDYHASEIGNLQTDKADKTEIPTKTSDLTNDSGYQTAAQVQSAISPLQTKAITDTGNYYTTDTVEGALQEIGAELAGVNTLIGSGVIT